MSDLRFSFPACIVAGKARITPEDVRLLRRHLWPEGIRSRQDAVMALALDECCGSHCPEWGIYVVEAVTEFVVWRESPTGEVSDETAGWLLQWLTDAGSVRSSAGFDILLHVLDVARSVPSFLSATLLNQVRLALLPAPRGAYARRRTGGPAVTKHDLALIWRVLRSGLDRGTVSLSRGERRILQEINELAAPQEHHPGWREMMRLARPETTMGEPLSADLPDPAQAEKAKSRAA
jgi:hypothetical protein